MNNTTKKTPAEKQLIKFRNQMHNLLIKYPEIRISGNSDGLPVAWIRTGEGYGEYCQLHLPTSAWIRTKDTDGYEQAYLQTSGMQELISK